MDETFYIKLAQCGHNREKLLELMADIDEQKRSLKSRLSRLSSEPDGAFGRGRERQVQIRKMKDKLGFLTEEREAVRARLGALKHGKKTMNKKTQARSCAFAYAFMAAAEICLNQDSYLELELKAVEILQPRETEK